MSVSNRTATINQTYKVLAKHYQPRPALERPLLEHLLHGCFLEDSRPEIADECFARLQESFFDWNEVRVTTVRELAELLRGLSDPNRAATQLKQTLHSIFEALYDFDLEPLRKLNLGAAVTQLQGFRGVSPFMVAYAVQHGLGGHQVPVSRGALEMLFAVGVIDDGELEQAVVPGLERAIPKNKGHEFASLLQQAAAEYAASPHGTAMKNLLSEIDPDYKARLAKRAAKKAEAAAAAKAAAEKLAAEKLAAEKAAAEKAAKPSKEAKGSKSKDADKDKALAKEGAAAKGAPKPPERDGEAGVKSDKDKAKPSTKEKDAKEVVGTKDKGAKDRAVTPAVKEVPPKARDAKEKERDKPREAPKDVSAKDKERDKKGLKDKGSVSGEKSRDPLKVAGKPTNKESKESKDKETSQVARDKAAKESSAKPKAKDGHKVDAKGASSKGPAKPPGKPPVPAKKKPSPADAKGAKKVPKKNEVKKTPPKSIAKKASPTAKKSASKQLARRKPR